MLAIRRSKPLLVAIAMGLLVAASLAGLASAGPNPPGNNGTVKVDGKAFDDAPNNEPHGRLCVPDRLLRLRRGRPRGRGATFEAHPPSRTCSRGSC